ncbi:MAG TPA: hypothetical protein DEQ80_01040 [Anaerolinea thermolimosa]|uniref:Uncharacterized protein n=1 Tax=Anaerolinea thermolimosa TaxID=229919 RepID=A0A3D1JCV7_9CHLR|nr:hypothetical protein [Anaerolinea thermolimosa]GAP08268.1 hypothetical protein ATHL_03170 [Anaerolinea thermolimosa]HCE16420.1 hypothetical protein [Anaerolinea thermolimosa]
MSNLINPIAHRVGRVLTCLQRMGWPFLYLGAALRGRVAPFGVWWIIRGNHPKITPELDV